jgi:hypothetical protein
MRLIERLESTKVDIDTHSSLKHGVTSFHISVLSDIHGNALLDDDGNNTCNPFYGYRAAVDELETMIKKASKLNI